MKITMIKDSQEVILCILEKIKYRADLTQEPSVEELKQRRYFEKLLKAQEKQSRRISASSMGTYFKWLKSQSLDGKRIKLSKEDWGYKVANCSIRNLDDLIGVLGVLKQKKIIVSFSENYDGMGGSYFEIVLPMDFDKRYEEFKEEMMEKAKTRAEEIRRQLEEKVRLRKEIDERINEKTKEILEKPKNGWLVFLTEDGIELKFNKETGNFIFGKVKGNFALETNEYKIFLHLLEGPSHKAKYIDLLELMYPNKKFEESLKQYQVERLALDTVIRNIKKDLGILPRKKAKNKDIFQTLKKWKGYRLKLE